MKRNMRIMMIAFYCILSCNILACAGNDKPISVNTLPIKAQILLTNYFGNHHNSHVSNLIPLSIKNYLQNNYPWQSVKKLEIKKKEYEVELSNGIDLTFNKHFQLIDID